MKGNIFCIVSVVPQNGAKYLATNLSYFIKKNKKNKNKKVLLIDFDFNNPTLCYHYVKDSIYSIDNLSLMEKDLDANLLEKTVVKTKLGFDVLRGTSLCNSEMFSRELIAKVLNISKEIYDYVFVVTNPYINNSATIISLLNAKKVILVAKNDYANDFKIKEVLVKISNFIKDKSTINIVYNYSNLLIKTKIPEEVKKQGIQSLTTLEYVPKSIDNINLEKKFAIGTQTINDRKFKQICKELIKD